MSSSEAQPASTPSNNIPSKGVSPQLVLSQAQLPDSARTSSDVDARLNGGQTTQSVQGTPTHPITNLPSEVLSQIFLQCLPDLAPVTFSPHSAPLLLTQICSSWRTLAFSTPALWDTLTLPAPTSGLAAQDVRLVEVFLRRSGTRDLSIDLGLIGGLAPWRTPIAHLENLEKVIDALLPHAGRIKVLENVTPRHLYHRLTLARLPKLERLLITDENDPRPVRHVAPGVEFPTSLQVLDAHHTMLDLMQSYLPARLSELYLREPVGEGRISVRNAIRLLSTLPMLEVCSLDITMPSDAHLAQSTGQLQHASLPRMEYLTLKWGPGIDVGPMLEVLDMTRLLSLSLCAHHTTPTPWEALENFAVRCHPPLAILLLNGHGPVHPSLVDCLKVWNNLENLTMTEYELDAAFLDALTPKPVPEYELESDSDDEDVEDPLVPFLEYLDFEWCTFPDFEAFIGLLEARGKRDDVPGNKLEYFRMATNALADEERRRVEQCGIENVDIRRY